eukprot:2038483-Rhodomonas_salina.4
MAQARDPRPHREGARQAGALPNQMHCTFETLHFVPGTRLECVSFRSPKPNAPRHLFPALCTRNAQKCISFRSTLARVSLHHLRYSRGKCRYQVPKRTSGDELMIAREASMEVPSPLSSYVFAAPCPVPTYAMCYAVSSTALRSCAVLSSAMLLPGTGLRAQATGGYGSSKRPGWYHPRRALRDARSYAMLSTDRTYVLRLIMRCSVAELAKKIRLGGKALRHQPKCVLNASPALNPSEPTCACGLSLNAC